MSGDADQEPLGDRISALLGLELQPWQLSLLEALFSVDEDGKYVVDHIEYVDGIASDFGFEREANADKGIQE